jgi:hypothetical protein
VGRDHCHGPAHVVERRAGPPGPGRPAQTATRLVYRPCDTGAEVHLWKLTGAGHGWPGADPEVARPQGPQTTLIDAAEEVWRFLRRFTRPDAPPLDRRRGARRAAARNDARGPLRPPFAPAAPHWRRGRASRILDGSGLVVGSLASLPRRSDRVPPPHLPHRGVQPTPAED